MRDDVYRPLLQPEEIGLLARPCEADREAAERAIEEATLLDVRPKIGGELYLRLTRGITYGLLMEGGEYDAYPFGRQRTAPIRRAFGGLKRAIAYYAYGRLLKQNGLTVTRYGVVHKSDEYSAKADGKEIATACEGIFEIADMYMQECLVYMNDNPDLFPDYRGREKMRSERVRTKIIGD